MRKSISLAVVLIATTACGGGHSSLSSSAVSGAYEFVVTSNVTGGVTLVEANLAANGDQSSANGPSQVQILTFEHKNWYVNGVCAGTAPGQNSVAATLGGSNLAMIFNEGGYTLPGQGVLTGATVAGNYSITGSTCSDLAGEVELGFPQGSDSGGFVGNQVPALAGTFSGILNFPSGTDNAALTLTEDTNQALTVIAQLTGPLDNGTFTLTGSAIGNIMFVSGLINARSVTLMGYFDRSGTFTGQPNSVLVFDYDTLAKSGLLLQR